MYTIANPCHKRNQSRDALTWDGCPLGLGLVVEDKPTEFSRVLTALHTCLPIPNLNFTLN